ncbi:hypothetical protein [Aeromicrobium sp. CTD01-1L150]|uniref:hypothetical protein n=1 Tax=Aeromicrobium sp. CTD01-1L150 TaxID=3341830 RepID=UPI0035BF8DBE
MSWFHLLTPAQTTGLLLEGLDVIAGAVLPESEATFADADVARAAFGHPDPADGPAGAPGRGRHTRTVGRFVDFLLLPEDLPVLDVADGQLAPTRVPSGASYWRLEADGTRHVISYYDTPAFGWRNVRGPVWPASEIGLRARWGNLDVIAAFEHATDRVTTPLAGDAGPRAAEGADDVHLVVRTGEDEDPPEGFEWTKTRVSRRTVPTSECELYERISLVVHDGVPGRVLDVTDGVATLMLERAVDGSREMGPSWHDLRVRESDLTDLVTREVPRGD